MSVFSSGSSFLLVDSACFWGAFRHLRRAAATFSGKSGSAVWKKRQRFLQTAASLFAKGSRAFCGKRQHFRAAPSGSRAAMCCPLVSGSPAKGCRPVRVPRVAQRDGGNYPFEGKGKLVNYYIVFQALFPVEVYGQAQFELRGAQVGDAVVGILQAGDGHRSGRGVVLLEYFLMIIVAH